ncbi:unnamed protein product [Schistosoma haematobium]|nr:unnamed protein product [Schistosoma haematobium]
MPKFSFKYYGNNVTRFEISRDGYIEIFGQGNLGIIHNTIPGVFHPEYEILHNNELLAVKWYLRTYVDGLTAKVTNMIHRNGKISFYYENIPTDPEEDDMYSKIHGAIRCEKKVEGNN